MRRYVLARTGQFGIQVGGTGHWGMRLAMQANGDATLLQGGHFLGVDHVPMAVIHGFGEIGQRGFARVIAQLFQRGNRLAQGPLGTLPCHDLLPSHLKQAFGIDPAEAPARHELLLEERQAPPDHVGHHEQQRRHIRLAQARQREIGVVLPAIIEGDEQCTRRQAGPALARGQHIRRGDHVVMTTEECKAALEQGGIQGVVRITGCPPRIGGIDHPVKHDHGQAAPVAKPVVQAEQPATIERLLDEIRQHGCSSSGFSHHTDIQPARAGHARHSLGTGADPCGRGDHRRR